MNEHATNSSAGSAGAFSPTTRRHSASRPKAWPFLSSFSRLKLPRFANSCPG